MNPHDVADLLAIGFFAACYVAATCAQLVLSRGRR